MSQVFGFHGIPGSVKNMAWRNSAFGEQNTVLFRAGIELGYYTIAVPRKYSRRIRRHRMSELITRADTATLLVS